MQPAASAFRRTTMPGRVPVLLSVPHAGRAYSPELLGAARIGRTALMTLEDPLVDRLVDRAITAGAEAIVADAPRALIDLNRSLDDLDPAMVSPPLDGSVSRRASFGLGLIPSRLAGHGAIWRSALTAGEVDRRIAQVHQPYHDAIAAMLGRIRDRFGAAILLDCHSMPPRARSLPGIVLGDRHGSSCADALVRAAEEACARGGLEASRNEPYAGGEIVARHGRPSDGIHALQIEIDRSLYLAPNLRDAGSGFVRMSQLLASIVTALATEAVSHPMAQAAE